MIDRSHLTRLLNGEREAFARHRPASRSAHENAEHLLGGVPMTWMSKNAGGFPLYLGGARGSRVTDLDGHEYRDFALGDAGAMAGHSPAAVVDAIGRRIYELGGIAAVMPTADAEWVGAELSRRFGMARWSFALTAAEANRAVCRLARAVTGRRTVVFHRHCSHGDVEESLLADASDVGNHRRGDDGSPGPGDGGRTGTARVAGMNDLDDLEEQLRHGDVAAVLIEPALTGSGIVLPDPGYHEGVRRLTRQYGALLLLDESRTFAAGPGGAVREWGLEPDAVVLGKAIGGGVPAGAFGLSAELADRAVTRTGPEIAGAARRPGPSEVGALTGSPLAMAATRATLEHVLTDDAFEGMIALAARFAEGMRSIVRRESLPWTVDQLGARVAYRLASPPSGSESDGTAAGNDELEDYLHVALANRGILLDPFRTAALMAPSTTDEDVEEHLACFDEVIRALVRN